MSSFTRNLTFALTIGLVVATAGAVAASDEAAAPAADELPQNAEQIEAASEMGPAACTIAIPDELILPDPNPQLCPDESCYADADCASYCPRGGDCVYFPSCPAPVCMCF